MKVNVISNSPSIYKVLAPLNFVSHLLGIRTITRNRYGNYNYCWLSLLASLAYLTSFYVILHIHKNHDPLSIYHQSDIVHVMNKLHFVGNILAMTFSYLLCHVNYRNEIQIFKTLEDVDIYLRSQNLGEKIDNKNKFLNKIQFFSLAYIYIIHFAILTISLEAILFGDFCELIHLVQFVFPTMINVTVQLQFHFYNLSLRTRVEIINANLNEKIANSTSTKSAAFFIMEKDIDNMLKIHKKITDTSRLVNKIYGIQELFSFAKCFILLLCDGYIVLYALTVGGDASSGYTIFASLRALVFHFIILLVDLRACMLLCAKINHTKNILFKIKIEPENEEGRNVIMVAVFKLMHDKLELTACDLFNMDFSFVFSMLASITTYLLILLQFDIDAAKSKFATMKANFTNTM